MSDGPIDLRRKLEDEIWDVIIVGGGPAGLSSAIYASRGGSRTLLIDKDKGSGAMGGPHLIANYPGFPEPIAAEDLLERFKVQASNLGAIIVQENVIYTDFRKEEKLVSTPSKTFKGRTIILATGSMGREPSIDGEIPFIGRGVHYCAICDGPSMEGKHVTVIGQVGRLHDELSLLSKFASKITVLSPTGTFTDRDIGILRAFSKVEPLLNRRVVRIDPGPSFSGIVLKDLEGREEVLHSEALFVYLMGNRPVTDYLADPLERGENGCIKVGHGGSTNIGGVFAVGDMTCREVRQVSLAVSEGMRAALTAQAYIDGRSGPSSQWGIGSSDRSHS